MVTGDFIDQPSGLDSDALITMFHRFWNTESIGILDNEDDKEAPAFLEQIYFKQSQYKVDLPWKEDHPEIPDHYTVCLNRLRFLQRKLLKSPELLREYDSVIRDQLEKRIIEPVTEDTANTLEVHKFTSSSKPVHYLPYHCVKACLHECELNSALNANRGNSNSIRIKRVHTLTGLCAL